MWKKFLASRVFWKVEQIYAGAYSYQIWSNKFLNEKYYVLQTNKDKGWIEIVERRTKPYESEKSGYTTLK